MKHRSTALAALAAMAVALGGGNGVPLPGVSKGHTPNKYEPHQGERERLRRAKRLKGRVAR